MLNKALYDALTVVYKQKPKISREGEVASIEYPIFNTLNSLYDETITIPARNIKGGEQYAVNCKYCKDKRHRLNFSYLFNTELIVGTTHYKCSDCLVNCYNEGCQKVPEFKQDMINSINAVIGKVDPVSVADMIEDNDDEEEDRLVNQVPIPDNLIDITDPRIPFYVKNYWLNHRRFSPDVLNHFGVKFTYINYPIKEGATICSQMVTIIPVYQNNDYWFYQIRLIPINGDPNNGYEKDQFDIELPKYIIPRGSKKNWALYNIDRAYTKKDIFLVEGPSDVWRIGDSAVARFGKSLSRAQINQLMIKAFGKNIIIVPDMDDPQALELAYKQQEQLRGLEAFNSVNISKLPEGIDPGDLQGTSEDVCQFLKEHIHLPEYNTSLLYGGPTIL